MGDYFLPTTLSGGTRTSPGARGGLRGLSDFLAGILIIFVTAASRKSERSAHHNILHFVSPSFI